jgi:hypothetical protein
MAHVYEIRAASVRGEMRKALGAQGKVVYDERKEIMQETIYDREAVFNADKRKLTRRLIDSERIQFAGPRVRLSNIAPYARKRSQMSGISKTFGHKLDSFWPGRAMQQTSARRRAIDLVAIRRAWQRGK